MLVIIESYHLVVHHDSGLRFETELGEQVSLEF